MSTIVMAACWPLSLSPPQKAVLISLADQANDQGSCWPSVATIATRTCLGERTVQRALRDLQHDGFLRVETGAMKANRYTLVLEAVRARTLAPPTSAPPSERHPGVSERHPRHSDTPVTAAPWGVTAAPQGAAGTGGGCQSGTLTVIEPIPNTPLPPEGELGLGEESDPPGKRVGMFGASPERPKKHPQGTTLATYLAECKALGVKAIPPSDPVYAYAASVALPDELLWLQWFVFKRKRLATHKRQRSWPQTFRNSVEGNWYRLWLLQPSGEYVLSTQGQQAQRLMDAEKGGANGAT